MMRRLMFGVLVSLGLSGAVQAQTVSDAFVDSLAEQGFVIQSTGYTWLWRIVVKATNGSYDREIVISRGSGQILQDNWTPVSGQESLVNPAHPTAPSANAGQDGRAGGQQGRDGQGQPGGPSGPGAPGGAGGPGGPGGAGGPGGRQ